LAQLLTRGGQIGVDEHGWLYPQFALLFRDVRPLILDNLAVLVKRRFAAS
jgi:hypothetical protein